jgi:hexosaminidase
MWSEHAPQNLVDSKVFPRLLAMSEVLWTAPKKRDYAAFTIRAEHQYKRLDALKVDYGFPAIPVEISTKIIDNSAIRSLEPNHLILSLEKKMPAVQLSYALRTSTSPQPDQFHAFDTPIKINYRTNVLVKATYLGKSYTDDLSRILDPHLAIGCGITLSYEPSKYYTGGGLHALNDGNLGSLNFRDGIWQAVQGQDMEAVLDLGESQSFSSLSTNWYHYGNAWIFRPLSVEYFYSTDGKAWTSIELVKPKKDMEESGESMETMMSQFAPVKARYIKMTAKNAGPCPAWHDAAGEPSWLFCDEVVVH